MKRWYRKGLALLVATLFFCCGLLIEPAQAQGEDEAQIIGGQTYETLEEAIAQAPENAEIVLLKGIERSTSISIHKNILLKLNGNTISLTGSAKITIPSANTVSISGGTIQSQSRGIELSGTLTLDDVEITSGDTAVYLKSGSNVTVQNGSVLKTTGSGIQTVNGTGKTLSFQNSTIVYEGTKSYHYAMYLTGENIDIQGCTIRNDMKGYAAVYLIVSSANGTAELKGNTITNASAEENQAVCIGWQSKGTITLGEGNTIHGSVRLTASATQEPAYRLKITGGKFSQENVLSFSQDSAKSRLEISGGSFQDNSAEDYVGPGYFMTASADPDYPYQVIGNSSAIGAVAYIPDTDTFYQDFAQATVDAGEHEVQLLADVQADALPKNINAMGKTIRFDGTFAQMIAKGTNLSNATIVCDDGSATNFGLQSGMIVSGTVEEGVLDTALAHLAAGYLMEYNTFTVRAESSFEARIGSIGYPYFANAISVATRNDSAQSQVNDEIVLLRDIPYQVESTPYACYTIDLNGHRIGSDGADFGFGIIPNNSLMPNNATITIRDSQGTGSICGRQYGVVTNGSLTGITLTLDHVNITAVADPGEESGMGIYFPSPNSTLNLIGGSVTGNTGIGIKGGTVNISGGTKVVATGAQKVPTAPAAGGIYNTGDAIYVEGGYGNDIQVNIRDGIFISENAKAVNMLFQEEGRAEQKVEISGGSFSSDVREYLAEGFQLQADGSVFEVVKKEQNPAVKPETPDSGEANDGTDTSIPRTNDNSLPWLWGILGGIALAGIVAALILKKRNA